MSSSEPFTFVEATTDIAKESYNDYVDILSAKAVSVDVQFSARLRKEHPELTLTAVPVTNLNLIRFANLGYASYELDLQHDKASRLRGYIPPGAKGEPSFLAEAIQYG
jgi:transitional endoplasmic reticulum ATPase